MSNAQDTGPLQRPRVPHSINNLPSVEDGGVNDRTVASPALGYGASRPQPSEIPLVDSPLDDMLPTMPTEYEEERDEEREAAMATLGHNEVAAISYDHEYYVSDVASPYLSERQAREDVNVTRRRHSVIAMSITATLLLGAAGGAGWYLWQALQSQQEHRSVQRYETETIERGDLLESVDTATLVEPIYQADVIANTSGTVAEAYVQDGAAVEEGAWLFRLDNPTITEAARKAQEALDAANGEAGMRTEELNQANEALGKAQEALDALKAANEQANKESDASKSPDEEKATDEDKETDADKAKDQAQRDKDIAQAQKVLDDAKAKAEVAQAASDAANAIVYGAQETLDNAQAQQNALTIVAPISGNASEMSDSSAVGSSVTGTTRLCTISDTSRFRVHVGVPAEYRDRVMVGQEVRLTFPTIKDLQVTSSIESLEEEGDTLMATAVFDNDDEHRLEVGLATDVSIVLKYVPDTLIVPLSAIRADEGGGTHLEVLLDPTRGIVTNVPVRVIETNPTHAAVEASNIQAGNAVLVADEDE